MNYRHTQFATAIFTSLLVAFEIYRREGHKDDG
jgi:hypothetical protein